MANYDVSGFDSVGYKIIRTQLSQAVDHTPLNRVDLGYFKYSQSQLPCAQMMNTDGEGINFNNNQMDIVYQQLWKIIAPQPDVAQDILEKLAFLFLTAPHRAELTDLGCISLTYVDSDMPMIGSPMDGTNYVAHLLLELRYNLPNPN